MLREYDKDYLRRKNSSRLNSKLLNLNFSKIKLFFIFLTMILVGQAQILRQISEVPKTSKGFTSPNVGVASALVRPLKQPAQNQPVLSSLNRQLHHQSVKKHQKIKLAQPVVLTLGRDLRKIKTLKNNCMNSKDNRRPQKS